MKIVFKYTQIAGSPFGEIRPRSKDRKHHSRHPLFVGCLEGRWHPDMADTSARCSASFISRASVGVVRRIPFKSIA